jgi:signal transduction histidine kinase
MADALEAAAQRKREIVAMVSHDLRTPLCSISGVLTLLGEGVLGPLSDKAQRQVSLAEKSTNRLIKLINDLLDAEKLEAGKLQVVPRQLQLAPLIEQSVNSVETLARERAINLQINAGDLPVFVDGDRFVQVLVNLLSNTIKFSPDGSTVKIDARLLDSDVEIAVTDEGRGVPPEFVDKIFQRFEQVDQADEAERKGSGLGLPICKAIVELHGGKIGVTSAPGKGSKFWFTVPAAARAPVHSSL